VNKAEVERRAQAIAAVVNKEMPEEIRQAQRAWKESGKPGHCPAVKEYVVAVNKRFQELAGPSTQLALPEMFTGRLSDEVVMRAKKQDLLDEARSDFVRLGAPPQVADALVEWTAAGQVGEEPTVVQNWYRHVRAQEKTQKALKDAADFADVKQVFRDEVRRLFAVGIEAGEITFETDEGETGRVARKSSETDAAPRQIIQLMIPPESAAAFATAFADAQEARKRETDLLIETSSDGRVTQVRHRAKDPRGRI
jgi:hypothetical protein